MAGVCYTYREFAQILRRNGWVLVRQRGDHYIYKHPNTFNVISINLRPNPIIIERLIKENNLKV